jgi:hypothetical protein
MTADMLIAAYAVVHLNAAGAVIRLVVTARLAFLCVLQHVYAQQASVKLSQCRCHYCIAY